MENHWEITGHIEARPGLLWPSIFIEELNDEDGLRVPSEGEPRRSLRMMHLPRVRGWIPTGATRVVEYEHGFIEISIEERRPWPMKSRRWRCVGDKPADAFLC